MNKREKETETLNEETVVSRESKNERWNSGSICGIGVKVKMEVRVRERERKRMRKRLWNWRQGSSVAKE